MRSSILNPLSTLRVSRYQIPAHKLTPNTSIQHRPLLIYHNAFPKDVSASAVEAHIRTVGIAVPQWRYTMFSRSHFHSTAHELLVVASGRAELCFGGEENPGRVEIEVSRGDVMVVPAGVAHKLIREGNGGEGFEMVGSYEKGKSWDMCYGEEGEEERVERIKDVEWWAKDPIYGSEGPVVD